MKKRYIANCLKKYAKSDPLRLHMPGHKGSGNLKFGKLYPYDITELSFSDNLANPTSIIKSAQRDIAKLCGAKCSYILTGGSTLGVLAMCYAVRNRGKKLIVQKGSHKSVFNALQLLNIQPVFLNEECEDGLITVRAFENEEVLESADNELIGALITSPDYFGRSANLQKIAKTLHKNGKLLLIDGAHGGHFSALNKGLYAGLYADAWVDGAHKTLSTLTQGAVLHLNNLKLKDEIERALDIFSTSSPNYLIMASVEDGVKGLHEISDESVKNYLLVKEQMQKDILKMGFSLVENDDLLKIGINLCGRANGYEISEFLERKGIYLELASENFLLMMLSVNLSWADASRFLEALRLAPLNGGETPLAKRGVLERKLDYLQAVNSPFEWVKLEDALFRVCAENAGLYPPCYPVITAGEVFDNGVIATLLSKSTFGVKDGRVKVVKEL